MDSSGLDLDSFPLEPIRTHCELVTTDPLEGHHSGIVGIPGLSPPWQTSCSSRKFPRNGYRHLFLGQSEISFIHFSHFRSFSHFFICSLISPPPPLVCILLSANSTKIKISFLNFSRILISYNRKGL